MNPVGAKVTYGQRTCTITGKARQLSSGTTVAKLDGIGLVYISAIRPNSEVSSGAKTT